ncbi:hypothetical protein SCOCK_80217 [Actinacidiphila cocklensis]|uniref:Uncharacterized protein n=1 Tax=Actinacidiphila cocklensis TaxID=887465 RepID=A0A9W4E170_9ACTN|nr:hypothetical protein SCOCK_80217 [Actinacidiphila cocklensis]
MLPFRCGVRHAVCNGGWHTHSVGSNLSHDVGCPSPGRVHAGRRGAMFRQQLPDRGSLRMLGP